jgi:hypothetical protein
MPHHQLGCDLEYPSIFRYNPVDLEVALCQTFHFTSWDEQNLMFLACKACLIKSTIYKLFVLCEGSPFNINDHRNVRH